MMVQTNYKTAEDEEKNTRQEYTLHKHVHMNSSARGENYWYRIVYYIQGYSYRYILLKQTHQILRLLEYK